MNKKVPGIVLLLLIIAGGIVYHQVDRQKKKAQEELAQQAHEQQQKFVELKGYVGGEKLALLRNEVVKDILREEYDIVLDPIKAGSIEMVKEQPPNDIDFLWPSSQVALELYKMKNHTLIKSEVIFNSPIVLYSWELVTKALQTQGFVEQEGNILYVTKFHDLISAISNGQKWSDIGLTDLFGKMAIMTTDPTKSNSGNMFAGLLVNILHGDVVDIDTVEPLLPQAKQIFARLGYMPPSSKNLFQDYLTKGVGDKPIIAGYESQAVEFSLQNPKAWPKIKEKIRILYPKPTVWSSHPLIILNEKAARLIEALQDEDIQKIAWEQHGFRTGLIGAQNDPKVLDIAGIPETITQVIPMPSPGVMEKIIAALQSES